MEALIVIVLFWVLPVWVGHEIGKKKNRAGWVWGLLLGWIGVIIVAVLGPSTPSAGSTSLRSGKDFVIYRPRVVEGTIRPGVNYAFRPSTEGVFRQLSGSDQWEPVTDAHERADVLTAMANDA